MHAQSPTFLGRAQYFGAPLKSTPLVYDTRYIRRLVEHFARLVARDHHNGLKETAFAVIAVEHDLASTNLLRQALFPSIYCATVDWRPTWGSNTQKKASANALVAALHDATQRAKAALVLLSNEVLARSNTTPLLLPVKNFSSDILVGELRALHVGLHRAEDHHEFLQMATERIKQAHPFQRIQDSSKRAYVDDRQITYQCPGRHRHAFARPNGDHPSSCILAGTRRFGAPYDRAFHYDCTKAGMPQLRGSFYGCHEPAAEYIGDPHLNVAPNDYVRR